MLKVVNQFALLKDTNIRKFWLGEAISLLGDRIDDIALMSLVYGLTGSMFNVGKLIVVANIPSLLFSPLIGVYLDRLNRKAVAILSALVKAIIVLLLTQAQTMEQIYALAFANASVSMVFAPSLAALFPDIVPKDKLIEANALRGITGRVLGVVGSGVGGLIVAGLGARWAFVVDALTFVFFAVMLSLLRVYSNEALHNESKNVSPNSIISDLREGILFVQSNKSVLFVLLVFVFASLSGGILDTLLLPFSLEILSTTAAGFGLLLVFRNIGGLFGMLMAPSLAKKVQKDMLIFIALLVTGINLIIFSRNTFIVFAFVLLAVEGIGGTSFLLSSKTILQETVPTRKRGRVFGLVNPLANGFYLISAGFAGLLAEHIGIQFMFFLSGVLLICCALIGKWKVFVCITTSFRNFRKFIPPT